MFVFGSGVLIGTQQNVSSPTPYNFGLVQEVSLNISVTTKPLFGQYNYPVAVGSGTRKVSCKAKLARISSGALGALFFNTPPVTGSTATQFGEAFAVPATPYQYTVANASSFAADQGVLYASSGFALKRVASSPAQGQYSVNTSTGIYTFAAADTSTNMLVSYSYTVTGTATANVQINQALVGPTSTFGAVLFATDPTTNKQFSVQIFQAVASKLSMSTKLEDFIMPDFEFECFANPQGNVLALNFGDNS